MAPACSLRALSMLISFTFPAVHVACSKGCSHCMPLQLKTGPLVTTVVPQGGVVDLRTRVSFRCTVVMVNLLKLPLNSTIVLLQRQFLVAAIHVFSVTCRCCSKLWWQRHPVQHCRPSLCCRAKPVHLSWAHISDYELSGVDVSWRPCGTQQAPPFAVPCSTTCIPITSGSAHVQMPNRRWRATS